jgi:hypothetical protein
MLVFLAYANKVCKCYLFKKRYKRIGHLYLNGVWLVVDLRTYKLYKNTCLKEIGLQSQIVSTTIIYSISTQLERPKCLLNAAITYTYFH